MLGIREPSIYGSESYEHLVELCEEAAQEAGFDTCECKQSNHEGDLVDYIQQAFGIHDGAMGGEVMILRAVTMSGSQLMPARLPYDLVERTVAGILEKAPNVLRVFYDQTPTQVGKELFQ